MLFLPFDGGERRGCSSTNTVVGLDSAPRKPGIIAGKSGGGVFHLYPRPREGCSCNGGGQMARLLAGGQFRPVGGNNAISWRKQVVAVMDHSNLWGRPYRVKYTAFQGDATRGCIRDWNMSPKVMY